MKTIPKLKLIRAVRIRGTVLALLAVGFTTVFTRAATLHVRLESPNPTPPYASWGTAATNIQHAVDAAAPGDTVLVTNGVYAIGIREGYRVVIGAVRVQSVTGPAHTSIVGAPDPASPYGSNSIRCVYLAAGAILDGFTLTNGQAGLRTDNPRYSRGGGAWCDSGAILTNCIITGNSALGDGAGVYGGALYRCVLTNNIGADDCDGGGADHSVLFQCLVTNNRGRKGGGVDQCTLYSCVLIGNNARVFGGGAARSDLYNCTVVENSSRRGGGVSGKAYGPSGDCASYDFHVFNSIVYNNQAVFGPNYAFSSDFDLDDVCPNELVFYYSCTTPMPQSGINNIIADPQLASWSHISSSSPCLGAGSANYSAGIDIDGQPYNNPPSMGADEVTLGPPALPLPTIETDFTNVTVGFPARFVLQVEGRTARTVWNFGDGTQATNQLVVTHTFQSLGVRSVELTAFDDALSNSITATVLVHVVSVAPSYVNVSNINPVFPYASWATAATNIQDAIAVTNVAGRVVLVTNGVYDTGAVAVWGSMSNRIALSNGVVVRSVNGPRFTFLRGVPAPGGTVGDGATRCAYVGDGSVLQGFTLTNGYTRAAGHTSREQGGGGAWCESRGVVTNCVFVGNTSSQDGGGANGGIFYGCIFMQNEAFDDGGAADDAELHNCVLKNNRASVSGGGATESVLSHCTVVANSNGGVTYSRVRNSILFYNNAGFGSDAELSQIDYSISGLGGGPPLFVNLATGDLHLRPGSPGIDAADLSDDTFIDLDGNPRPLDGNKDGLARADMGAYEFNGLYFTSVTKTGSNVRVCWYDTLPGMQLQASGTLSPPVWTNVPVAPGTNCVELPASASPLFFRLVK